MSAALPLTGLAFGAIASTAGATSLSALIWGGGDLSKKDRTTIGVVAVGLLGFGTVLTALSSMRLAEGGG